MIFSTVEKLALYALLLAAVVFGIYRLDMSRQRIGYNKAVAEYNVKLIAAKEDAKAQEVAWQSRQKDIQKETNDAINKRDTDYAALSRTTDSLRNAAANYGNGLPDDTIAACLERTRTLADVFGQCASALRDVAKAADGQYIDAVSCRESWPNL